MKKHILLSVMLLTGTCMFAQEAKKSPAMIQPTELESVKIQLLQTQMQLLQNQATTISQQMQGVVAGMEAAHPGYKWDGHVLTHVDPPATKAKK